MVGTRWCPMVPPSSLPSQSTQVPGGPSPLPGAIESSPSWCTVVLGERVLTSQRSHEPRWCSVVPATYQATIRRERVLTSQRSHEPCYSWSSMRRSLLAIRHVAGCLLSHYENTCATLCDISALRKIYCGWTSVGSPGLPCVALCCGAVCYELPGC